MNTIPNETMQMLKAMQSPLMAKDATLRDLFAGMALQGLCMNPPTETEALTDCASLAYNIADAMLLARKDQP